MATFVLVHGGALGGYTWSAVARLLRAEGHEVFTPTLTGLGERVHLLSPSVGLATHIEDIVNVLRYEEIDRAVLVGSSYGGIVISGVAERIPERIGHLIYLDGMVLRDGESAYDHFPPDVQAEIDRARAVPGVLVETLPPGFSPRATPQPLRTLIEPIRIGNPAAARLPRTFVRCVSPRHPALERSAGYVRADSSWTYRELDAGHGAPVSAPDAVAALLVDALDGDPTAAASGSP